MRRGPPVNPVQERALRDMLAGPLVYEPDIGWMPGEYNNLTVRWLFSRRLVAPTVRGQIGITAAGRALLMQIDGERVAA